VRERRDATNARGLLEGKTALKAKVIESALVGVS
jgi:hypothetical protein